MGMQLLAGTMECRNGNCPTAWLTERGSVIVQGYVATPQLVRVPRDLIERAARELVMHGVEPGAVPAPRSTALRAAGEWFEVAGTPTTLRCPAGERAHEVPALAVLAAAAESTRRPYDPRT
ncbi:hypothetical protein Ae717Ps2_7306c [Pseudonocardia sp. Ae717_Ps2]|nr:hypothetical protein Ae717Ps2_7306c [Pseudonocardia sp. Ae717_Ps2]